MTVGCAGKTINCLGGTCETQCGYFDVQSEGATLGNAEIMLVQTASSGLNWYTDGVFVHPSQGLTRTAPLIGSFTGFLLSLSQSAASSLTYCSSPPALSLSKAINSTSNDLWTALLQSVFVNNRSIAVSSTEVLFNSTEADIQMPPQDYESVVRAVLGESEEGEVWRSCVGVGDLPNITLEIGQLCFDIPASSYFGTGVQEGDCKLLISPGSWNDSLQSSLHWSLGYSFLWNYEILFNTTEGSIFLTGGYECPSLRSHSSHRTLPPWAIALIVVGGALGLAGTVLGLVLYIRKRKRPYSIAPSEVLDKNSFTSSA